MALSRFLNIFSKSKSKEEVDEEINTLTENIIRLDQDIVELNKKQEFKQHLYKLANNELEQMKSLYPNIFNNRYYNPENEFVQVKFDKAKKDMYENADNISKKEQQRELEIRKLERLYKKREKAALMAITTKERKKAAERRAEEEAETRAARVIMASEAIELPSPAPLPPPRVYLGGFSKKKRFKTRKFNRGSRQKTKNRKIKKRKTNYNDRRQ